MASKAINWLGEKIWDISMSIEVGFEAAGKAIGWIGYKVSAKLSQLSYDIDPNW